MPRFSICPLCRFMMILVVLLGVMAFAKPSFSRESPFPSTGSFFVGHDLGVPVNLRALPWGRIISRISPGDELSIPPGLPGVDGASISAAALPGWRWISSKGLTGWVAESYLTSRTPFPGMPPGRNSLVWIRGTRGVGTPMRRAPGLSEPAKGCFPEMETPLLMAETRGEWCLIKNLDSGQGYWAHSDALFGTVREFSDFVPRVFDPFPELGRLVDPAEIISPFPVASGRTIIAAGLYDSGASVFHEKATETRFETIEGPVTVRRIGGVCLYSRPAGSARMAVVLGNNGLLYGLEEAGQVKGFVSAGGSPSNSAGAGTRSGKSLSVLPAGGWKSGESDWPGPDVPGLPEFRWFLDAASTIYSLNPSHLGSVYARFFHGDRFRVFAGSSFSPGEGGAIDSNGAGLFLFDSQGRVMLTRSLISNRSDGVTAPVVTSMAFMAGGDIALFDRALRMVKILNSRGLFMRCIENLPQDSEVFSISGGLAVHSALEGRSMVFDSNGVLLFSVLAKGRRVWGGSSMSGLEPENGRWTLIIEDFSEQFPDSGSQNFRAASSGIRGKVHRVETGIPSGCPAEPAGSDGLTVVVAWRGISGEAGNISGTWGRIAGDSPPEHQAVHGLMAVGYEAVGGSLLWKTGPWPRPCPTVGLTRLSMIPEPGGRVLYIYFDGMRHNVCRVDTGAGK